MIEDDDVRHYSMVVEKYAQRLIRHVRTFTTVFTMPFFLCRAPETAAPEDLLLFSAASRGRRRRWWREHQCFGCGAAFLLLQPMKRLDRPRC